MTATLELDRLDLAASSVDGYAEPRIMHVPDSRLRSRVDEAVDLAESAGMTLDPWQVLVLTESLRVRGETWAALRVGLNVARQNGKNSILEVREAAGLFCWGERLIQHSAHLWDTSLEAFRRLEEFIEEANLGSKVKRIVRSHGEEGIELLSKQRIRFRTRTKGSGRGMTGDTVIFDEAMFLDQLAHRALFPTLTAVENPQVWYTGSAVDREANDHGHVFADVRERGIKGDDRRLAYFEWSAHIGAPAKDTPVDLADETMADVEAWAQANPALGIRVSEDYIHAEMNALDARSFAVERLGIGDWPDAEVGESVIPVERWDALADETSELEGPVAVAFDSSPDRRSAVAAACRRSDGKFHVEIVRAENGTGWVEDELARLRDVYPVSGQPVCDAFGPVASLVHRLEGAGIHVQTVTSTEHARACAALLDVIADDDLRHPGTDEIRRSLKGAKTRPLSDAWAWSRKNSTVDISPLVAATLALWAASENRSSVYDTRGMVAL